VLARSREAARLNQLRGLGMALENYLQDNQRTLPIMQPGRSYKNDDMPALETVLLPFVESPDAFKCPQDRAEFEKSGSSHMWNSSQSGKPALHDVSFSVARGGIHGLLGHNGAGKSTTLGIILGMVMPDSGDVSIGGVSVLESRSHALRKVGATFESPAFYEYLRGWENLRLLMGCSGRFDARAARETADLEPWEKAIPLIHAMGGEIPMPGHIRLPHGADPAALVESLVRNGAGSPN
jgi:hypothetical protein